MKLTNIISTKLKFFFILYILLGTEIQNSLATIDYCKLPCLANNTIVEHVICTLKNDCSVGPECKVKSKLELTREIKRSILNIHNVYRNKVALGEAVGNNEVHLPQGADLLEMVWDDELAYFAQCYANKCILQYDKCRQNSARENIGQLIFIRITVNPKTTEEIIMEMIESVFYSSKYLSRGEIEAHRDNKLTKQFTQLFWSRTNRVGCGVTRLLEDLYAYFMVCNYGPAGNIEGEKVYKIGLPCSSCPNHRICGELYSGLCAAIGNERNGLGSIPAFLTTLERIMDPSLQKNKSDNNSEIDESTEQTIIDPSLQKNKSDNNSAIDETAEQKITDPSLQKNESDNNSAIDENTEETVSFKNYIENEENKSKKFDEIENEKSIYNFSYSIEINESDTLTTSEVREIAVRICKVKRKNGWKHFNRQTGETSSAEDPPYVQNLHIVLMCFLFNFSLYYIIP